MPTTKQLKFDFRALDRAASLSSVTAEQNLTQLLSATTTLYKHHEDRLRAFFPPGSRPFAGLNAAGTKASKKKEDGTLAHDAGISSQVPNILRLHTDSDHLFCFGASFFQRQLARLLTMLMGGCKDASYGTILFTRVKLAPSIVKVIIYDTPHLCDTGISLYYMPHFCFQQQSCLRAAAPPASIA
jgi:hypothetical protein